MVDKRWDDTAIELFILTFDPHFSRKAAGDRNIYFIDTTGWVTWDDVFPEYVNLVSFHSDVGPNICSSNQHPSNAGHKKVAGLLEDWLKKWGLRAVDRWASQF